MYRKSVEPKKPAISTEELIKDLRQVSAKFNHHYFRVKEYEEHGNFNQKTIIARFKTWETALKSAGLVHYNDEIVGQVFGYAKVLERTDEKDSSYYYLWKCSCQICGTVFFTTQTRLKQSKTTSCGCRRGQVMRDPDSWKNEVMRGYKIDHETGLRFQDFNKKRLKNNTSGYTGVYKYGNKWAAEIHVKGVRYRKTGFDGPKEAYENGRIQLEKEYLPEYFRKKSKEFRTNQK